MSDFTDDEVADIRLTQYITCSLALFASACVVVSHLRDREPVAFTLKLTYYLCLSDLFTEISALLSMPFLDSLSADIEDLHPILCQLQAAGTYYFKICSCFWTMSIAYTCYRLINHFDTTCYRYEKHFHIINWGFPLILTLAMFSLDAFGPIVPFCFIDEEHSSLRFPMFYAVIFSIVMVDVYFYILVIRGIHQHIDESKEYLQLKEDSYHRFEAKVSKRIVHTVLVFIVTWAMPIANRIYILFDPSPNFWLYWCHFFFGPLEGFWNGIIYGDNKRIRKKLGLTGASMGERH